MYSCGENCCSDLIYLRFICDDREHITWGLILNCNRVPQRSMFSAKISNSLALLPNVHEGGPSALHLAPIFGNADTSEMIHDAQSSTLR